MARFKNGIDLDAVEEDVQKVLEKINMGFAITKAVESIGYWHTDFLKKLSKEQKELLKTTKKNYRNNEYRKHTKGVDG